MRGYYKLCKLILYSSICKEMKVFKLLLFIVLAISFGAQASPRIKYSINDNWRFMRRDVGGAMQEKFDDSGWQVINLPHTWNAADVMDDEPGYYRDIAWYRRSVNIPAAHAGKQVTILFEGANQEKELYVNGQKVGSHVGGYTRFSFDITAFLRFGERNVFAVKVNNRYNKFIPPLTADFTFFGGIYRDVFLIVTEQQHVSTTHYASDGVYLSTPRVSEANADVEVKTMLTNASLQQSNLRVEHTLLDADRKEVITVSKRVRLAGNTSNFEDIQKFNVKAPALWSPETPVIYTVRTRIFDDRSKKLRDEVYQPLGFRWYEFTTEKGFLLNGKPYKLIGTNRHQCYDGLGNALPDEIHVRDVLLLKEMAGNFLRVSHYPQDPTVMEMCDKLGIITKIEIPIVNAITEHEEFYQNCLTMAREMVYQDYNRPSLLIWAYMNEVLLRPPFRDDPERHATYLKSVEQLAKSIEKQIRDIDPYRYTLLPMHGSFDLYHESGLTRIPMIIGWNLYQGWYGGTFDGFDKYLDDAQEVLKGVPFIITEYGADVDPRLHSLDPVRFDYTQEWANLYHEHYIKAIMERTYIVGANIWNLNDFHSEERGYAVPHINNKGVVSTTRQFKDTYLHYQAFFRKDPIVNIGGRNWNIRGGVAGDNYRCVQPVKVYSNLPEVEFFLNGVSLGKKKTTDAIAEFMVPFVNGENVLEAAGVSGGRQLRDLVRVDFRLIANDLKDRKLPFESINVMLGSKRHFEDKDKSVIWLPEKPYTPGSWGYVGGKNYVKRTRHGQLPASDLNILNTNIDPVFQTKRHGIEHFKLDVPDGEYTVSLYFAELMSRNVKVLAYNLGNDAIADDLDERVFSVEINGTKLIHDLNIAQEYGEHTAVVKKFSVQVTDGKGIDIRFLPIKDEAILNAIRVYRNY